MSVTAASSVGIMVVTSSDGATDVSTVGASAVGAPESIVPSYDEERTSEVTPESHCTFASCTGAGAFVVGID